MRPRIAAFALVFLAAAGAQAAPPAHRDIGLLSSARQPGKIARAVFIAFQRRPNVAGGWLEPAERTGIAVRFTAPSESDARDLELAGVVVLRRPDGRAWIFGDYLAGKADPKAVAAASALARVERIELDGSPFGVMPALDQTAQEIGATAAWRETIGGLPVDGSGVSLCDIDSGLDVFHPSFFRADGGYQAWIDGDKNGAFDPGSDSVLVGGKAARLRTLDGVVSYFWDPSPELGSDDPQYDPATDWLYADLNGNGQRDLGRAANFDDTSPSFGEPLFVADDVNGDGKLDPGEKIVALKSSKIAAFRDNKAKIYERGKNLVDAPRDAESSHGTAVAGVLVGGQRGLTRYVGIANGGEALSAADNTGTNLTDLAAFCVNHKARVVVHEYGVWWGEFLDGSGPMEQFIDASSPTVAHATAAGNLSTSNKGYRAVLPAGAVTTITIKAPQKNPYGPFGFLGGTLLWREPARILAITIEDPKGSIHPLPVTPKSVEEGWPNGYTLDADRADSKRGTARIDFFVYDPISKKTITPGEWKIHIDDGASAGKAPLTMVGFVVDDKSGWGAGVQFADDVSEDHLVCYPATADSAITTAAYELNGYDGAGKLGDRAYYSGRGHRIDGAPLLTVAAPADPISAGYFPGKEARYVFFNGTSGATPHVAGTAALLLQTNPALTGLAVRDRIRKSALVDSYVGTAPNDDWGYGKLRAYRALFAKDPPEGAGPSLSVPPATVLAGMPGNVPFSVADADFPGSAVDVELDRDYDGAYDEHLAGGSFAVQFDDVGRRYLKLRATDPAHKTAQALAVVDVVAELPKPQPKPDPTPAPYAPIVVSDAPDLTGRSCLCSAPGAPAAAPRWELALAALAIARFRRRRL